MDSDEEHKDTEDHVHIHQDDINESEDGNTSEEREEEDERLLLEQNLHSQRQEENGKQQEHKNIDGGNTGVEENCGEGPEEQRGQDGENDDPQERNEDEVHANSAYIDAIFALMPCIIGKKEWRHHGRNADGIFSNFIKESDEVMLLWVLDCYWNEWVGDENKQWRITEELFEKRNVLKDTCDFTENHENRPLKTPYFVRQPNPSSDDDGKQRSIKRRYGGTTVQGKKKWNEYAKKVKQKRNRPEFKTVFETEFKKRWDDYNQGNASLDNNNASNNNGGFCEEALDDL